MGETLTKSLKNKNIKHSITSPYHPQANGRVERLNGVLIHTLEKIMDNKDKNTWPKYFKHALLVARVRTNNNTGYSAFELTYGYRPQVVSHNEEPYLAIPQGKAPTEQNVPQLKVMCGQAKKVSVTQVKESLRSIKEKPLPIGSIV